MASKLIKRNIVSATGFSDRIILCYPLFVPSAFLLTLFPSCLDQCSRVPSSGLLLIRGNRYSPRCHVLSVSSSAYFGSRIVSVARVPPLRIIEELLPAAVYTVFLSVSLIILCLLQSIGELKNKSCEYLH